MVGLSLSNKDRARMKPDYIMINSLGLAAGYLPNGAPTVWILSSVCKLLVYVSMQKALFIELPWICFSPQTRLFQSCFHMTWRTNRSFVGTYPRQEIGSGPGMLACIPLLSTTRRNITRPRITHRVGHVVFCAEVSGFQIWKFCFFFHTCHLYICRP